MAWEDVPAKLAQYDTTLYAPENAAAKLLALYQATKLSEVAVDQREDFEDKLDYRLGACLNLAASKAIRPAK
jgi:hypothetical protein